MAKEKVILHIKDASSGEVSKKNIDRAELNQALQKGGGELYVIMHGSEELSVPKDLWMIWGDISTLNFMGIVDKELDAVCSGYIRLCEKLYETYNTIDQQVHSQRLGDNFDYDPYIQKVEEAIILARSKSKVAFAIFKTIQGGQAGGNGSRVVSDLMLAVYDIMSAYAECFEILDKQLKGLRDQANGTRKLGFFEYRKIVKAKKIAIRRAQALGQHLNIAIRNFNSI